MEKRKLIYCLLVLLLLLTGCANQTYTEFGKPIIKIGYLPVTHAGPLYLDAHIHEGKFPNYEIEMVKFGSWPDLMDALNTGRVQGASVLIELAMKAKEKGIDLKAVALGHKDGNVLISAKDIDSAADLVGKTFAIPHKYSTHNLLLNEYLMNGNVTYNDVSIVEMPPAEMPVALAEDRIAGYVVAEPFGALSVVMDTGKVLQDSRELWPNSYCCVLVLRGEFLENEEDAATDFIKQYVISGALADERDELVYESFLQFMKVKREVLDLSLGWISYDGLEIEEAEYNKLRARLMDMQLMDNPPTFAEFVDNSYLGGVGD